MSAKVKWPALQWVWGAAAELISLLAGGPKVSMAVSFATCPGYVAFFSLQEGEKGEEWPNRQHNMNVCSACGRLHLSLLLYCSGVHSDQQGSISIQGVFLIGQGFWGLLLVA